MRETKQSFYDVIMGYDEGIYIIHIYIYILLLVVVVVVVVVLLLLIINY